MLVHHDAATMAGREVAKKVVADMAKGNGFIPPDLLETMESTLPKDALDNLLAVMGNLRIHAAASVKTLAQNLYSSSAQFVFELLQNYDDNRYTESGGPASVTFCIYPDRIVISCNEAGFTAENVKAICSVGQSSKKKAEALLEGDVGYTGEKGIGFKSVFMAAEEAHIQSGDYSFRFVCKKGDSGLGMTTPIWEDHDESLDANLSHITLTLRRDGGPTDRKRRQDIIHEQFHNIHDSILLFMKRLEHIKISFYDDGDLITSSTVFTIDRQTKRTTVKKTKTTWDSSRKETTKEAVQYYAMVKHVVNNLAPRENDEGLDETVPVKPTSDGVVVLGFPMDKDYVPILNNEYIFSFLPIKQMGFKFLIHADFVTQANREDIITTSKRNEGLAGGIVEAFLQAIISFCENDTLQYTWMRYLPHENDYPWNKFWKCIIRHIRERIEHMPVLRSSQITQLLQPSACRLIPSDMLDREGQPLVADTAPYCYPSPKYQKQDLQLLCGCGLRYMTVDEWFERLSQDVTGPISTYKITDDEIWHTRVAHLLSQKIKRDLSQRRSMQRIKHLDLIPIQDRRWVSAASGPVYYSKTIQGSLDIPLDLDLAIVDDGAASNFSRRRLFNELGVCIAQVNAVREEILSRYNRPFSVQHGCSVAHLRFLYLSHHLATPPYGYNQLYLWPQKGFMMKCSSDDMYLPDDGPYGATQLLTPTPAGNKPGDGAPGFKSVLIMKDEYFKDEPKPPTPLSLSWRPWIHKFLGVRQHLRLADASGKATAICKYVAEHRPEKFLQFLRVTWDSDKRTPAMEKLLVDELGDVEVLCRGGRKEPLRSTYFTLPHWTKLADVFLDREFFPWLLLERDLVKDSLLLSRWKKLCDAFGLGYHTPTQSFLIDILKWIKKENRTAGDVKNPRRICQLYVHLQAEIEKSKTPKEAADEVRRQFKADDLIFLPGSSQQMAKWALPKDCMWGTPVTILSKADLDSMYGRVYATQTFFEQDRPHLQAFFSETLKIPVCSWRDVVREIQHIKINSNERLFNVTALYTHLSNFCEESMSPDELHELKDKIETDKLVWNSSFRGSDSKARLQWHSLTECRWANSEKPPELTGILFLDSIYPKMQKLFVEILGVRILTARLAYNRLIGPQLPTEKIKVAIRIFNAFLRIGNISSDMSPIMLSGKCIFPVRRQDGTVMLRRCQDAFALPDRESLERIFLGYASFLDFDIDELRDLQPFVSWVGLEARYLSRMVKETTHIGIHPICSRAGPDREIGHKARAFYSLAMAYRSPRISGGRNTQFYALLRNAQILMTDHITSTFRLYMGCEALIVNRTAAKALVQEDEMSLKVYVPKDELRQELCFANTLPEVLCEWMMREQDARPDQNSIPRDMVQTAQSLLSAKPIAMPGILDYWGIKYLDAPNDEDGIDGANATSPLMDPAAGSNTTHTRPHRIKVRLPPSVQCHSEEPIFQGTYVSKGHDQN